MPRQTAVFGAPDKIRTCDLCLRRTQAHPSGGQLRAFLRQRRLERNGNITRLRGHSADAFRCWSRPRADRRDGGDHTRAAASRRWSRGSPRQGPLGCSVRSRLHQKTSTWRCARLRPSRAQGSSMTPPVTHGDAVSIMDRIGERGLLYVYNLNLRHPASPSAAGGPASRR